jgi:choline-sulfatase
VPRRTLSSLTALLTALIALPLASGCRQGASDPPAAPAPEAAADAPAAAAASRRTGLVTARALAEESHRAELDAGGLFVDLGAGDGHKYIQGAWANGWGARREEADGTSVIEMTGRAAALRFYVEPDTAPPRAIAVRLRIGGAPRRLALLIDGKRAGDAEVATGWNTLHLPLARGRLAGPGWRELGLVFAFAEGAVGAELDWIWLAQDPGRQPPVAGPRVGPIALGQGTRRGLLAGTPRTYAFHLEVPAAASLVFDRGAALETRFLVRARIDGQPAKVLFDQRAAGGQWQESVVDLTPFADKAIRLELQTSGPTTSAGWAEPEVLVAPAVDEPPRPVRPGPAPRGLILLVIDTVRADVFPAFNPDSRVKTPVFDKLVEESIVFLNAYSNENWTKPAVATILSGLYPSTHGAKREPDVLSPQVKLLSERLRERGFSTAAFIANGYVSDRFGFKRGWDRYRNYIRENRPSEAEAVFADAQAWLARQGGRPFFLYLQTIDPHVTYAAPAAYTRLYHPEPYRGPLGPTLDGKEQAAISRRGKPIDAADQRWIRALYDAEVSYHDAQLGRFLEAITRWRKLDDTLLVITNDHGEEIGDRGRHGHGHSLHEELIRAPLLMRYPPRFAARRIRTLVENVDLVPTILETLGLPPAPNLDGVSLIGTLQGRPPGVPAHTITEFLDRHRAVRVGSWKMLASAGGTRRLFNLKTDPGERRDLAAEASVARRMCEQHLAEALATPAKLARFRDLRANPRRFAVGKVKADPELRRQLEALGYFGGPQ